MQSMFNTVDVPTVGNTAIGPVYTAPTANWIRLLVRNLGGGVVYFAFETSAINTTAISARHFELPSGVDTVFVLAPGQALYATSPGGTRLSFAASVALPIGSP